MCYICFGSRRIRKKTWTGMSERFYVTMKKKKKNCHFKELIQFIPTTQSNSIRKTPSTVVFYVCFLSTIIESMLSTFVLLICLFTFYVCFLYTFVFFIRLFSFYVHFIYMFFFFILLSSACHNSQCYI